MGYNHRAIDLVLRSIDARDRTAHRSVVDFLVADNKHLSAELAAAIRERDEARRWLCEVLSSPDKVTGLAMPGLGTPRDFAAENGWDCFEGGGA